MNAVPSWAKSSIMIAGLTILFSIPLSILHAQETNQAITAEAPAESPTATPDAVDETADVEVEDSKYSNLPQGSITFGATAQEDYVEGTGDLLVPLFFNGEIMAFINPRSSFTDQNEEEVNVGFGVRKLMGEDEGILGLNTYWDRRETELGSSFDQIGFGIEFLSACFDARANYYLPLRSKELVREFELSETSVSRQRSTSTSVDAGAPVATGNSIVQPATVTTVERIRTTTRTTTRGFREFETTMEGWDAEVGIPIPLPSLEEHIQAKLFGGYYSFNGVMGVQDIEGFRGRLEVELFPNLLFDAAYYTDDDFNGGNYSLGLYFSMPFDLTEVIQGGNPFKGAGKLSDPNDMYLRLGEMVKRDPQIRTQVAAPVAVENSEKTEETTRTTVVSSVSTSGVAEIATDITFVDGEGGDDNNPGTFEQPKETVQGGVDEPRSMVFVHDVSTNYEENVVLTDNVVLRGAGKPIQAMGGQTFGSGIYPVVDGGGNGPTITLANNTSVTGLQIQNTPATPTAQFNVGPIPGPGVANLPTLGATDVSRVGILGNDVSDVAINDNIIVGNSYGVLIDRLGDLKVSASRNSIMSNMIHGASIIGQGNSGTYDVTLEGNNSSQNNVFGFELTAQNYDDALVRLIDNTTSENGVFGSFALIDTADSLFFEMTGHTANSNASIGVQNSLSSSGGVVSVVSDSEFNDNPAFGLLHLVTGGSAAITAAGGLTANNNGAIGLQIISEATNGISAVFGGLDPELTEYLVTLLDILGLGPVPEELAPLLTATGPIVANNNGLGTLVTSDGEILSLVGLFDLQANNNTNGPGAIIDVNSDSGFAAGLVSDSETFADTIDLIKDVVELLAGPTGVPDVPDVTSDPMSFSNNGGPGLIMTVEGEILALNAAAGIEANENNGEGVILSSTATNGLAATLGQNIVALNNTNTGVIATAEGDFFALNLLADIAANNNGGNGITQTAISTNGIAAAVLASTDPIRSLISVLNSEIPLDPPITLGGTPFGPVTASGNNGYGLFSTVESAGPAIGVYLDVQANSNALTGIRADITSEDSVSFGLLGSSDFLFHLVGGVLGGGHIPHIYLGPVQANNNMGGGVEFNMDADDESIFLGFGIEAMNNASTNGTGNGFTLDQTGYGIFSLLAEINASGNAGTGISLLADGAYDVDFTVIDAEVNNNFVGLDIDAYSEFEDIYAGLLGIEANQNEDRGIFFRGETGDDIYASLSGSQAVSNGNDGVRVNLISADDTELYIGGTNFVSGSFIGGPLPPELIALLPASGTNTFSNNGDTGASLSVDAGDDIDFVMTDTYMDNNESRGLRAKLTAAEDIVIGIQSSTANNNTNAGFRVIAVSDTTNVVATFNNNIATNNVKDGLNLDLTAQEDVILTMNDNTLSDNGRNGANIDLTATNEVRAFGSRNIMTNNTRFGMILDAAAPSMILNYGQNGSGIGNNQFFGNGNKDVRFNGAGTLLAENNWWGANIDPVANGQTQGTVDADPWLTTAP